MKFGKLTAIKAVGRKNKLQRGQLWECICDCGNHVTTSGTSLRIGTTQSCGCSRQTPEFKLTISNRNKIDKEKAAINNLFSRYKNSAKNRKINFNLTKENFTTLVKSNCYFCNSPPDKALNVSILTEERIVYLNGIDRLNSTENYTTDNVVPCCKKCNYAKGDLSVNEFKEHIQKLISFATN